MAHDHVVENNPRRETLLALVGILMFAAMVVLIALSAWLRPVAPDTKEMIAQREAAAAPAAAPAADATATAAAPATTPAADSTAAAMTTTPAADSTAAAMTTAPAADAATAAPASAAGTDNAVTGGETQAAKVADAGASTVKTTN